MLGHSSRRIKEVEGPSMKALIVAALASTLLIAGAAAQHSHAANGDQVMHSHHPTGEADGTPGTITGYVRDVACLIRNPKAGAATTPLTRDCLEKCIRGGSPIAILGEDGSLYLPVSDVIPDTTVRAKLVPYAGKYVKASGKLFERGGMHTISIENIEVVNRPANSKIPVL